MHTSYTIRKAYVKELWDKITIFIILFYSFFASILHMLNIPVYVATAAIWLIILTNKLYVRSSLVCVGLFILCFVNILLFQVELTEYISTFLFCFIPMIFVSGNIDYEKYHKYIYRVSCLYLVVLLYYVIFVFSQTLTIDPDFMDNMGFSYYSLIPATIIVYNFFKEKRIINLLFVLLSMAYFFICGTRGPIICYILFIIFCVLRKLKKIIKFGLVGLLFFIPIILYLDTFVEKLYPFLRENNISTIWIQYIYTGDELLSATGRDDIYNLVWNHISANPIFGTGLYSDRALVGDMYAHNIVLEVLCAFGIPIGSLLVILLIRLIVAAYQTTQSDIYRYYIIIYTIASVVKLMVSSSFIQEYNLFILIGICLSIFQKRRKTPRRIAIASC